MTVFLRPRLVNTRSTIYLVVLVVVGFIGWNAHWGHLSSGKIVTTFFVLRWILASICFHFFDFSLYVANVSSLFTSTGCSVKLIFFLSYPKLEKLIISFNWENASWPTSDSRCMRLSAKWTSDRWYAACSILVSLSSSNCNASLSYLLYVTSISR